MNNKLFIKIINFLFVLEVILWILHFIYLNLHKSWTVFVDFYLFTHVIILNVAYFFLIEDSDELRKTYRSYNKYKNLRNENNRL